MILAFFGYNESFAGAGGAGEVQAGPGGLHQAHARRKNTTARPRRGWCSSRRSRTRTCTTATCPTARRTTPGSSSTRPPWPRWPASNSVPFVDLFAPSLALYAKTEQAADDQRHSSERTGRPSNWPTVIDQALFGRRGERCARRRPAGKAAPGGDRQELQLVRALSHDRRLFDLRRPGRSEVRQRPDQSRGHAARDGSARRDDGQSRPAHLGRRRRAAT